MRPGAVLPFLILSGIRTIGFAGSQLNPPIFPRV
ncbi:exported hypothetical protein [Bradyrhizobium sp. ORS 375]|nr:exported hypothetical protein [Bradyrhizobium sp. ORS 375]